MYVKFPGILVTCISYENYVYRTVKDKWGVGSSLDLSPIKAPIQYKRKPLNIYW
jgi:hypothetical protein